MSFPFSRVRFTQPLVLAFSAACTLAGMMGGCRFTSCETTRTCGGDTALGGAGGENANQGGENGTGASFGEGGLGGATTGGGGPDQCNIDEIICDGECVEPLFDNDHCGATSNCRGDNAGDRCLGDEVCSEGMCSNECSGGRLNCEGSCVDPLTDERFCGATGMCNGKAESGMACDADEVCLMGECRGWSEPLVFGSAWSVTESLLAVNAEGDGVLSWQEESDGIYSTEFTFADSTWSSSTMRSSGEGTVKFPALATGDSGFSLVWVEKPTSNSLTRVYEDHWEEGAWAEPVEVSPNPTKFPFVGDSLKTSVAVDSAGNRFLVWEEGDFSGPILAHVWEPQAAAWSEFEVIGDDFGVTGSPAVAAIGKNKGLVVWNEEVDEDLVLRSCTISASAACDPATIHSDATLDVGAPLLAGSEAGNAAAVWAAGGSVWAIAYDGGKWGEAKNIGVGTSPRLAFGGEKYAALAFQRSGYISINLRTVGSAGWGLKTSFPASAPSGVDVAIDGKGNVVLVWVAEAEGGDGDGIFASRFEREDGRWSDAIQIGVADSSAQELRVALHSDGLGLLTYSTTGKLHFSEFR